MLQDCLAVGSSSASGRPVWSALAALGVLLQSGCSEQVSVPRTVPVTGSVNVDGKPAAGVRVQFHAQFRMGRTQFLPTCETDKEGFFSASTAVPNDGLPPGSYKVTFMKPRVVSDPKQSGLEVEVDDWHEQYLDPEESPFEVTIASEPTTLEPFELESPTKKL